MPDFCGHGVRNALGTTFQLKSNFTPSLSLASLEPLETKNSVAALETKEASLTMPQLKRMRQASKPIKRKMERNSPNAHYDSESEFSAYNRGFLYDDLEKKDISNLETLESERNNGAASKRTPELTWKIESSAIADRRSRSSQSEASVTTSRPESPQIVFQENNSEEAYQLRECTAPKSQV